MTWQAARVGPTPTPDPLVVVVVPTRDSAATLPACLLSVRAQRYPHACIVVDNFSADGTLEIAKSLATCTVQLGPERSAQRNFGARIFPAGIVGFIDSDMQLTSEVLEQVAVAVRAGGEAVVVPEVSVGTTFWARVKAFEKSFYAGCDNVEAARFFTTRRFQQLGGFDESLNAGEDWDLTLRARQAGCPVVRITASIIHNEGALGYWQSCRKKAAYAKGLRAFARKHGASGVKQAMRRPYLERPWLLLRQPGLGLGLILLKSGELSAVLTALVADLWS